MGRELKRVPLDFDYPLNKVWYGYFMNTVTTCHSSNHEYCINCKRMAEIKGVKITSYGCPDFETYFEEVNKKLNELCEAPIGEGYQLWETTSEGSPVSPVFDTLEKLCEWCEVNATTFGSFRASKEEWMSMLSGGIVAHKEGNAIFI